MPRSQKNAPDRLISGTESLRQGKVFDLGYVSTEKVDHAFLSEIDSFEGSFQSVARFDKTRALNTLIVEMQKHG